MKEQLFSDHPAVALRLLGEFTLSRGEERIDLPLTSQRLVALVALADYPLSRGRIWGSLWPDASDEQGARCLRTAIWRASVSGCRVLSTFQNRVALAGHVACDLMAASDVVERLASRPGYLPDEAEQALLAGELLPSWDDEWLVAPRERIRNQHVHALEVLCGRLMRASQHSRAIDVALLAVHADPLRDKAHAALIRAYLADGHRGRALRQFRSYAAMLEAELGIAPDPDLENLVRPLLQQPQRGQPRTEIFRSDRAGGARAWRDTPQRVAVGRRAPEPARTASYPAM